MAGQSEGKWPDTAEFLPRVRRLLSLTLLSLGLCVVLWAATVIQVSRIQCTPPGRAQGPAKNTSWVPHVLSQSHLEQIHQQLSHINTALAGLCRPCPWGWESFQGSCYVFSYTLGSWEASASSCRALGAHLVIINSAEEQMFLRYWNVRKTRRTWIGLTDLRRENSWQWEDGTPLELNFWQEGEPNNLGDEDCAEIHEESWVDSKCTTQNFWICEQPAAPCPGL